MKIIQSRLGARAWARLIAIPRFGVAQSTCQKYADMVARAFEYMGVEAEILKIENSGTKLAALWFIGEAAKIKCLEGRIRKEIDNA